MEGVGGGGGEQGFLYDFEQEGKNQYTWTRELTWVCHLLVKVGYC